MLNKNQIIDEILAVVAPEGEANAGIYRFQIALALPSIIQQMVHDIISGSYSDGGVNPVLNTGLSGNSIDTSNLLQHLRRRYSLDISSELADLSTALKNDEPIILEYGFTDVRHVSIPSKLSMFVPDEDQVDILGEIYGNEAIVYTVIDGIFNQAGSAEDFSAL